MAMEHKTDELQTGLQRIRRRIVTMGKIVQAMITTSLEAFLTTDKDLAFETIHKDDEVDNLEIALDKMCVEVISRFQPDGDDLRFVAAAMKQVTDLERIADLCVNICEKTIELNNKTTFHHHLGLQDMAEETIALVHDSLTSFIGQDVSLAEEILGRDRIIDAYYMQVYRQLLELMARDKKSISEATRVHAVANNLERIGDHSANIAERVIFMVTGEDIRHRDTRQRADNEPPSGVLFLCAHNSARSQMAEAWARTLLPNSVNVYSAGADPVAHVHPLAVRAMAQAGIDISSQRPKAIPHVPLGKVDMVVTLCGEEVCVNLPRHITRRQWDVPDPTAEGDKAGTLKTFENTSRELARRIKKLAQTLYRQT